MGSFPTKENVKGTKEMRELLYLLYKKKPEPRGEERRGKKGGYR